MPVHVIEADQTQLVDALRRAADGLTENRSIRDLEVVVDRLVRSAVATIPGAEGGGISRTEPGTVRSSHATSPEIYDLDQLQSALNEGPCITAADDPPTTGVVVAADLAGVDAERWPTFAAPAVRAGYRSMMSLGLSVQGGRRSALNLYAARPDVFDLPAQLVGGVFALQAAMLLHGADHAAQLGHAVETRDVIGQAKGILMERFTVDDTEAFGMLVSSSQDTNIKLVEVAHWLVAEARNRRADAGPRHARPAAEAPPLPLVGPDHP